MAEKIILCISGIIKTVSSEYEILGVGEMKNPENAMIITDKRVILLTVPMSGSGKVIGGFSFIYPASLLFNYKNFAVNFM